MTNTHAHIMVDLETLGTVPGCSILSIGAVRFFPEEERLGDTFYVVINRESCRAVYLQEDKDTIAWWNRQGDEARKVLDEAYSSDNDLASALHAFNRYLLGQGGPRNLRIWGNGADFDNPILACAYDAAGVKAFAGATWGNRCYRTLKNLGELFPGVMQFDKLSGRTGTHHNALDDAISQANHMMRNLARIRGEY